MITGEHKDEDDVEAVKVDIGENVAYPKATTNDNGDGSHLARNVDRLKEKGVAVIRSHGGSRLITICAAVFLLVEAVIDILNTHESSPMLPYIRYAIAFSVVLIIFAGGYLVLERQGKLEDTHKLYLTVFLALWAVVGVGIITFKAPYTLTGNGYFASWIAFAGVYQLLKDNLAQMSNVERKIRSLGEHLFPLCISSVVELFAAVAFCTVQCRETNAYAVAVGIVSALVCVLLAFFGGALGQSARKVIAVLLFFWWTAAVFVLTFGSPFNFTGNGYFSVWISFFLSTLYLEAEFHQPL